MIPLRCASRCAASCATTCALVAALGAPAAALAQPSNDRGVPPTHDTGPAASSDSTQRFRLDISPRPLPDALAELARQTGLHIEATSRIVGDRPALALSGQMTVPAALRLLLEGTRYRATFRDPGWVVITLMESGDVRSLDRVVVTASSTRRGAYATARTSSATRTDTPLRDVPQAVTVVGASLIADQSMRSMSDVVRYVPGITMGQGEGHRDAPTIRGQSSTADFYVDGVRDDAQYLRDVYNVERVEALKGANALAFGRGGGGGVLNRVSKEAQWSPRQNLTLEGGSFDHRRATLDVGDALGGSVALRLNGVREDSRLFRDATSLERTGINPTATILAGETVVRLGYEFFDDRRTVDRGIPSFQGLPSPASRTTFFGDPAQSWSRSTVHAASVTAERETAGGLLLRSRTRLTDYDKAYQNVFPGALDASGTSVSLSAYNSATARRNAFTQGDLTWTAQTGALRHTLLVGGELGRQVSDNDRETGYLADGSTSWRVPFAAPTVEAPLTFRLSASDADNRVTANVASTWIQDQLALGDRWEAILGLRYDRFALALRNHRTGETLRRTDGMVSPRAALVFKPAEAVSVYGSHGVSFLPSSGDQFAALTATTQTLRPEEFRNQEVGVKWEPRADLSVTTAVYQLDRSNAAAPSPNNPAVLVQTGRQRTTGAELGVSGHLTDRWQVAGGWTTQRARFLTRTAGALEGATVPLVPRHTLSLWNRWQATSRAGLGLGVVYQDDMYAALDNAVTLPGFTRVDASLHLTMTRWLRAQVNVENLLDRRYFPTSHGNNNIMPGAPRMVRISLSTAS